MYRFLLIALCAAGLAGCSHFGMGRTGSIDPKFPQVSVVNNYIVVNQEPILVRRGDRITWQLPGHSNLRFTADGIVVDAFLGPLPKPSKEPIRKPAPVPSRAKASDNPFGCRAENEQREFVCTVPRDALLGQYSYVIRLKDGDTYLILDPTFMIDE